MKKLILLTGVVFSAIMVNAQAINLHASAISSNISAKDDGGDKIGYYKSMISWKAGIGFDWKIASNFNFMPEVNLLTKGAKIDTSGSGFSLKGSQKFLYMEVPLNFVYNTGSKKGGFFIGAGPSLGIGFSGKQKTTTTVGGVVGAEQSVDIKFDGQENATDNNGHLKAFELGANFLAGYRITEKFFIHANYNLGLSNIAVEDNNSKASGKNNYFGIGFGYVLTQ